MNFTQARENMINQQIKPWYVTNPLVLDVMQSISRETFVPPQFVNLAYSDTDIPLMEGQTMLSPKVVGRALQALDIQSTDSVLEIGTGTGYVTACLGRLATHVISFEIFESLHKLATRKLRDNREMDHVILKLDNGIPGYEPQAPYDVIILTGALPLGVTKTLCHQLSENNGRLFAFVGKQPAMRAILITRQQSEFHTQPLFETVVPPLLHAPESEKFVF